MTKTEESLWRNIESFELDDPDSELTFSERLARENRWTMEYSLRCIEEYKKFIFMICIADHPLTPSDQVDQVWHLHLLYTQSYWIELCQNTLGKTIHHGPTRGGEQEQSKFTDWYAKTKELYTNFFNCTPPADIWPSSEVRFGEINFQRINLDKNWVVKKFYR
ncbi:MAG: glycine-rich domain-containing protein [Cytophagaceae bacterium]